MGLTVRKQPATRADCVNAEERKNEYELIHSKAATGIMHALCAIVYVTSDKDIGISVIRISQFS